jgi:class 3 adenylate cyclase
MTQAVEDRLQEGRTAFERHAWRAAYEGFRTADAESPLDAPDLERLGEAAWWLGRLDDVIGGLERAYASYQSNGLRRDAARTALRLAAEVGHRQEHAVASGWLRRAERLLANEPESVEHALLSRAHSNDALDRSDYDSALEQAHATYAIAERLSDPDLMALGLHDQGRALVAMGQVDEGMALIDEATVAAVGGELGPHATAAVYCNTINACRDVADYGRAGEWTEAAKRWCERQSIAGFPGMCRVRRAEIVRLRGAWPEAEREARLATAELGAFYLDYAAEGFYQLGEIRMRVGDLGGAEDYFRQARELGRDPQPGLALLRLSQGRPEAGATMIHRALEDDSGSDRLGRARLLPAHVEIAVALAHLDTAGQASEELTAIAQAFGTRALRASAAWARGTVALAQGDAGGGAAEARQAWRLWQEIDAPYEVARSRALLGSALKAAGDGDAATSEFESALAGFERLGAEPDATAIRHQLGRDERPVTPIERIEMTFMFTDVVGSTQLIEAIGDEAWENLLRWHDETLHGLVQANGGEVIEHTGDGFLAVFSDPSSALASARAIQRALADHRHEHGFAPQVRIGVHAGSGMRHGGSYSGAGVHTAARITALAGEGEIVASVTTLAATSQPYEASEPREVKLKGISRLVEVASVGWH